MAESETVVCAVWMPFVWNGRTYKRGTVLRLTAAEFADPWVAAHVIEGDSVEGYVPPEVPDDPGEWERYEPNRPHVPEALTASIAAGQFPVEVQRSNTGWFWDAAGLAAGMGQPLWDHGTDWYANTGGGTRLGPVTGPEDNEPEAGDTLTFTSGDDTYTCTYKADETEQYTFAAPGAKDTETGTHSLGLAARDGGGWDVTFDGEPTGAYYDSSGDYVMGSADWMWSITLDDYDSPAFATECVLPGTAFPLAVTPEGESEPTLVWTGWGVPPEGADEGHELQVRAAEDGGGYILGCAGGPDIAAFNADLTFDALADGIDAVTFAGDAPVADTSPSLGLPAVRLASLPVNGIEVAGGTLTLALPRPSPVLPRDTSVDIRNTSTDTALQLAFEGADEAYKLCAADGEDIDDMTEVAAGTRARFLISETAFRIGGLPVIELDRYDVQIVEAS